jgi:hypothetical protein
VNNDRVLRIFFLLRFFGLKIRCEREKGEDGRTTAASFLFALFLKENQVGNICLLKIFIGRNQWHVKPQ